jgi:heme oxygenase
MIDLLRARTATHHDGLEHDLRIEERLSGVDSRGALIAGYRTFYSEYEAALRPHLQDMADLTFASRFRSRKVPGMAEQACPGHPLAGAVLPAIGTKAEALGAMYVLEGSTLGGRIILKTLRSQGVSTDQLGFLNPYGSDASALWRAFLNVLERETAPDQTAMNACVAGAIKAFGFAAICLREERIN